MIRSTTKKGCPRAREAVLGEPPAAESFKDHAAGCPSCGAWLDTVEQMRRTADLCSAERLDDLARMRIQSRLGEALDKLEARSARWPVWLWPAATVGATALIMLLGIGVALRWSRHGGLPAPVRPALSRALLVPYGASGTWLTAGSRPPLGRPGHELSVPPGSTLHAALSQRGRLALYGPARLRVDHLAAHRLELRLDGGLLLAQVRHSDDRELRVRAGGLTAIVVGTTFAIDARRAGQPTVSVLEGLIVAHGADGRRHPVAAGQAWWPGLGPATRVDPAVALALVQLGRGVSPPSGDSATVVVRGVPEPASAALEGNVPLGETPLVIQLAPGTARLALSAAGRAAAALEVQAERGQTTLVQYALAPAAGLAPATGPAVAKLHPEPGRRAPAVRKRWAAPVDGAEDLYARAEALLRAGDTPGAQRLLTEALRRYPNDGSAGAARYELARLSYRRQDARAAVEHLRALLGEGRFRGLHDASHFLICKIDAEARRTDQAVRCFQAYRQQYPRSVHDAEALYTLSQLVELGQGCRVAGPLLDEYLKLYPGGALAPKVLARRKRCP